eukprot:PITA_05180
MDVKTAFSNGTIDERVIILLYVDDLILDGVEDGIEECKQQLAAEFYMKDLGSLHYYLGLEIWQGPDEVYFGQAKYVIKMLKRFGMMDFKPLTTPMIRNLKRLMSSKSNPVDPSIQFQVEPKHDHWIATKHILRYLQGTIHYCLKFDRRNDVHLMGYIDSDWRGSEKDGRSTTGGCFSLGSSMISWMRRKQDKVSLGSAEAEYVKLCEVVIQPVQRTGGPYSHIL